MPSLPNGLPDSSAAPAAAGEPLDSGPGTLADPASCFNTVLERAPLVLWCVDRQGQFVSLSGQGLERLGYQPTELVGRSVFEVFSSSPELAAVVRQALDGNEATTIVSLGQGVFRWWCAPWRQPDGQLLGAHGFATDITELSVAETALQRREEFFQSLAQLSPVGVLRADRRGHCYYVNDRACQIIGLSAREVLRLGWLSAVHPTDRPEVEARWAETLARGESTLQVEFRFVRPDSQATWVLAHVAAQRDEHSQPAGFVATFTDISHRKQTEQALEQSEARWRLLLESVPEYILTIDPAGVLLFSNRFHQGTRAEDYVGRNLLDLIPPEVRPTLRDALQRASGGECVSYEVPWIAPDGQRRWFENRMGPLVRGGRVTEMIVVASDITERKQAEAELRQSHEELEQRVKARTDELQTVNRDLQSQKHLLELVLSSISSGVLVVDEQGNLMLTNPAAHQILGLRLWQTINARDGHTFYQADQSTPYTFDDHPLGRAIRGETLWSVSMYAHPPGTSRGVWLKANAAPMRSATGEICGAVLVFRDDTERRQAEESLRLSLERFNLTVHGSREGLWDIWINPQDPFLPESPCYYSRRFKESLGYADDEFPNVLRSWLDCIYPEDRERVLQALERTCSTACPTISNIAPWPRVACCAGSMRAARPVGIARGARCGCRARSWTSPPARKPKRRCVPANSATGGSWKPPMSFPGKWILPPAN